LFNDGNGLYSLIHPISASNSLNDGNYEVSLARVSDRAGNSGAIGERTDDWPYNHLLLYASFDSNETVSGSVIDKNFSLDWSDGDGNYEVHGAARRAGRDSNALLFDGVDDEITFTLALDNKVTFEFWLYYVGGVASVIRDNTSSDGWIIGWDNSGTWTYRINGTSVGTVATNTLINRWSHHALTFDGTNSNYYIDGILVKTDSSASFGANIAPWHLMKNGTSASGYINGLLDEVAIYDVALDGNTILNQYNAFKVNYSDSEDGNSIYLDNTAPSAPTSDANVEWTASDGNVTLTEPSDNSGVKCIYRRDSDSGQDTNSWTAMLGYDSNIFFPWLGNNTEYYRLDANCVDGAGNWSPTLFDIVQLGTGPNKAPDVNIVLPNGSETWDIESNDYNHLIKFTVSDADGNHLTAHLYYSSDANSFENSIIDLNLHWIGTAGNQTVDANCEDNDFSNSTECWFDVNVFGWGKGDYFVDVNVSDSSDSNAVDSSDSSFSVIISSALCGTTITGNTTLTEDMTDCTGDGLIIGADSITLDCDGYGIYSDGLATSGENGIDMTGSYNTITIKNCDINGFYRGINFDDRGADSNIYRCNITYNVEIGVRLDDADRTVIQDCNIRNNVNDGIFVTSAPDVSIFDNNVSANQDKGMYLHISSDFNIMNNIIEDNSDDGIWLYESDDAYIKSNHFSGNGGVGFEAAYSVDNLFFSDNNSIENNSAGFNSRNGCSNSTISDNNFSANTSSGISGDGSQTHDNNFSNNIIKNNGSYGIYFTNGPTDNNFYNEIIEDNDAGSQGIWLQAYSGLVGDNRFFDCNIGGHTDDFYLKGRSGVRDMNSFSIGTNFTTVNFGDANGFLYVGWWLDVNVVDGSTSAVIDGATVTITDQYGLEKWSGSTNANGVITRQYVFDYNQNSDGQNSYSPYDINVIVTGYDTNGMTVSIDENKELTIRMADHTVPTISSLIPADGSSVSAQTVSFTVSDAGKGVDSGTIFVKLGGVASSVFSFATHCSGSSASYSCSYTETGIATGSNTLTVDADDSAGNSAVQASSIFTYSTGSSPDDPNPSYVCGDGGCQPGENCSNCPMDCGTCSTGGGGSGGGSGGEGASTPAEKLGLGAFCNIDSVCESGDCINHFCGDCYDTNDCEQDEQCTNNVCSQIAGACGHAIGHEWFEYECCRNEDCEGGRVCTENHKCEITDESILYVKFDPEKPVEGEQFKIFIYQTGNILVENVKVLIDDRNYTAINGTLSKVLDGGLHRIDVNKQNYKSDSFWFRVYKKAQLIVKAEAPEVGDFIPIVLRDDGGNPLKEVEVLVILPDGSERVMKTNKEGIVYIQSQVAGKIEVNLPKYTGYLPISHEINILETGSLGGGLSEFLVPAIVLFSVLLLLVGIQVFGKRGGKSGLDLVSDEI